MSGNFEFNAPTFFNMSDDPYADRFFDVVQGNDKKSPVQKRDNSMDKQDTENKDPINGNKIEMSEEEKSPNSRKVLNEIINQPDQIGGENVQKNKAIAFVSEEELLRDFESLHIAKDSSCKKVVKTPYRKTHIFEGIEIQKPPLKKHSMFTRLDSQLKTPILKLRNRCVTKSCGMTCEALNEKEIVTPLDLRKPAAIKRKGSPLSGSKKFVSLAERIQHFHFDTPDRFRSNPKQHIVPQMKKLRQTIPKTPVLAAKYRHRPVNFPNEKQREELELVEMKKYQVKAYPLNEKILKGPVLNIKSVVEKKPTTVPEPFKLTEIKKKEHTQSPVFVFKAQPLPSAILNGPVGVPPRKVFKATVPQTPKIKVPLRFTNLIGSEKKTSNPDKTINSRTTKIEPFSFDQKIKDMLIKKEENIKKVIEEERKAHSSFRAHPLPNFIGRGVANHNSSLNRSTTKAQNSSLLNSSKKEPEKSSTGVFKARPATAVHQKPFVPIKPKHEAVIAEKICLNTEKRALERQKFDEMVKKKEEMQAQILKERKEEEAMLEQQKKMEERKMTEFKAKPVPKYKPFELVPADPSILTLPKTPRCLTHK